MDKQRRSQLRKSVVNSKLRRLLSGTSLVYTAVIAIILPKYTSAQNTCIPLSGSTACPAYTNSTISIRDYTIALFPFLSSVSDGQSFDAAIRSYVALGYVQSKYQELFGCSNIDLNNTTDLYARYTFSFICNSIIQNSISQCNIPNEYCRPLCADTCADFALSEESIVGDPTLCGRSGSNAVAQLRADYTNCALPINSTTGSICMPGYVNEPDNCGFQNNLQGLCSYCSQSTINSTLSCCFTSNAQGRCLNVQLPVFSSLQPLFATSVSSLSATGIATTTPSATISLTPITASSPRANGGLSKGKIAGIVVGSIIGGLLLLGLLILGCLGLQRRRRGRNENRTLNLPTPARSREKLEALPGVRVTRMTAIEGGLSNSLSHTNDGPTSSDETSPASQLGGVGVFGTAVPQRNKSQLRSSEGSPEESSPEGPSDSEQLPYFKDYYSSDEIFPGDQVSALWAYAPRARDEHELERGDMLKIVGIWDDGWATGFRLPERADEWEAHNASRDSGMSDDVRDMESLPPRGEVKAFPLVCVCLPQHWRRTIEGDSTDLGSTDNSPGN